MKRYLMFLVFFVMVMLNSCSISRKSHKTMAGKNGVEAASNCSHSAVIELSESCGILLNIEGKGAFQVTQIDDPTFSFVPGAHVQVDFVEETGIVPSCEQVKAAVHVTCVDLIPELNVRTDSSCRNVNDVLGVSWMNQVIGKYNPSVVAKYQRGDGWAYAFEGKSGKVIYDCNGHLLCRTDYGDKQGCTEVLKQLKNRQVLLKVDY